MADGRVGNRQDPCRGVCDVGLEVQSQHLASAVRIALADGVDDGLVLQMWTEIECKRRW